MHRRDRILRTAGRWGKCATGVLLFAAALTGMTGGHALAQEPASVTWSCSAADSLRVSGVTGSVSGSPTTGTNFVVRDYAAPGSTQRWWPGNGVAWGGESEPVLNRYIEYRMEASTGKTLQVSNVFLQLGGGGTSGMRANIVYSLASDFSSPVTLNSAGELALSSGTYSSFTYDFSALVPEGSPFTLRVYPWYTGASATTGKYLYVQGVGIAGMTVTGGTGSRLVVATSPITGITHQSAVTGGSILSGAGSPIVAKGVCWNLSGTPTVADRVIDAGSGTGNFASTLTALSPSTTYHVRAFATDAETTAYGNDLAFTTSAPPQTAFPGAEGWGRFTIGGRGGIVHEVTNLNDAGAGSLRAAVQASGPRVVVFRVSGTITLASSLTISNPYITIAGQTAPGDGICLRKYPLVVNTNQVIIRYIRTRLGNESGGESDSFTGRGVTDVIIDHCSASWSEDETMSFYWCNNFTIQWCLISESLYNSSHPKGAHGYGGIWGGANATYHHNLMAHHSSRNPRFASGSGNTDFRNNIIYNWGFNSSYGGEAHDTTWDSPFTSINMVANYYKKGPATKSGVTTRIINPSTRNGLAGYGKWYVTGNVVEGSSQATADNWTYGVQGPSATEKIAIRSDVPFPSAPITEQSPGDAFESVMRDVGANRPRRDTLDERILREVRTGTATYDSPTYRADHAISSSILKTGIIDAQTVVGGWPVLSSLPAPVDTDHDGMPDAWETANGLNPGDAADRNTVGQDGYTMLEHYLNSPELLTGVEDTGLVPEGFRLHQNFPNPFNPATMVTYSLTRTTNVRISVMNLLGQEIQQLVDGNQSAGVHQVLFNAGAHSSGVYFVRMTTGEGTCTKTIHLVK